MRISLIIPVRLTATTFEAAERLERICTTVPRDLFEIVISDYGTTPQHRGPLDALAASAKGGGIRVVRHPAPEPLFSIGKCRDFGVQMAACPIIMFNDMDFICQTDMYRAIHQEVMRRDLATNRFDVLTIPVMFLTEDGSRSWLSGFAAGHAPLSNLSLADTEAMDSDIQFTAFGSSAMVINKAHYLSLGGHDPGFKGHGAEDYEFLHRLTALAPRAQRPHEYLTDFRNNGVRHYWGFRPFFALHGIDLFLRHIRMVHLFHPRRKERGYFRARKNFRILRKAMVRFDKTGRQPAPLADLNDQRRLVIITRHRDRAQSALRQVIATFGQTEIVPPGQDLAAAGKKAPDLVVHFLASANEPHPANSDTPVVWLDAAGNLAGSNLAGSNLAGSNLAGSNVTGQTLGLATRLGVPIAGFFDNIVLGDAGGTRTRLVAAGKIPAPYQPASPELEPFGGPDMLDRNKHPAPERRKKSPLHIRLWRSIRRY